MAKTFIHLHVHTEFSLVDSVVRVKPLMSAVAEQGMPAIALTDQNNLFALVKFYRSALAKGLQPIIGCEVLIRSTAGNPPTRLVLLCQNKQGYKNLAELLSKAYLDGQSSGLPLVEKDWVLSHAQGLIALSAGMHSDVGGALKAGKWEKATEHLQSWLTGFAGRFYIELQRTGRDGEAHYNPAAIRLAAEHDVPVVATNDVRFLKQDDFEAHEARVCIHDGRTLADPRRQKLYSNQQYLRSADEMQALFADIPAAVTNTVEVAQRCHLALHMGEYFLPQFPIPQGDTTDSYFSRICREGLQVRLAQLQRAQAWSETKIQEYKDRLEIEIDVILKMGFPGYFLIVADFIKWAKENDVPVGPGRGSGAGSLVAYALEITNLDPLEYELLFERFLNPERVSMPDFDVDFCMEGRDRVIDYVADHYGREKVSQIITYGTMAAKAVVRDVGRVFGHPYGFVDRIAKLVPFEVGMTLSKALDDSEDLANAYKNEEDVRALLDMALSLEGLARNAGKHAGGVVIAPSALTDFTPLYCEADQGGLVTQLDKDDVESVGLVKFDFLGLRTLTIIDWALKAINRRLNEPLDIDTIPLDDTATFDLLKAQGTTAVFQLESSGMKDLIKRLQPDVFEDIIALVALFRPGPLQSGMVDDFINRKHGRQALDYPHDDLEQVLKPTYGVILYQEQVMQIAQILAGYSLGGADLLRRAMGKKKPEEMAKQREIFTQGAIEHGVEEATATYIFDLMEKFAGYGFNKSHSAAYALLSYQTAWLKTHYPAEFMAAVLSSDMDNTEKVVMLIEECQTMSLSVKPPSVNYSHHKFTVHDGNIVYGLGAIKGLGSAAIESIAHERAENGDFISLHDFCARVDSSKVNKRSLEALVRSGAMDDLCPMDFEGDRYQCRASLIASLGDALKAAEQSQSDARSGQDDMFGESIKAKAAALADLVDTKPWVDDERLSGEKETLGLYLTGHPINRFLSEIRQISTKRLIDYIELGQSKGLSQSSGGGQRYGHKKDIPATVAGLVIDIRTKNFRTGRMAFLKLCDGSARLEVVIGPEDFAAQGHLIEKEKVLIAEGGLGYDDFSGSYRVRARQFFSMDAARANYARRLELTLNLATASTPDSSDLINHIKQTLQPYTKQQQGVCPIIIRYRNQTATVPIKLDAGWKVAPSENLLEQLQDLMGQQSVALVY